MRVGLAVEDDDGDELTEEEMDWDASEVLPESEWRAGAETAEDEDEKARWGMNRSFYKETQREQRKPSRRGQPKGGRGRAGRDVKADGGWLSSPLLP